MAVVFGTAITLASLLSMGASAGAVGADIVKIAQGLKAQGHPLDKPIPLPTQEAVRIAMKALPSSFGVLAMQDRPTVQQAINVTASIYIEDATIAEYRKQALEALYSLAQYLDITV